ncbi:hypothetical protein [Marinobacterium aestuariivivens]|uniref:DUF3074 domain-containing protein n=1 Tax=Marinobacterium aestuariivivens TaxID=1698799 RepID=A0ABW2A5E5_9GAMM
MTDILEAWKYTDQVSTDRRKALAEPGSFDELISRVCVEAEVVKAKKDTGSDSSLIGCWRPIFTIELQDTGDQLFNGPWGYRAQFWESPERGMEANLLLIESLYPILLEFIQRHPAGDMSTKDVEQRLTASSAKIWPDESQLCLAGPSKDLDVDRWRTEADAGQWKANVGLAAPKVSKFEVKGAFFDSNTWNEVVPEQKLQRHHEIHQFGFS